MELDVSDLSWEDTLDNVSSIKTIHAVCAHYTWLSASNTTRLRINELPLTETCLHLRHKVTISQHFFFNNVDQLRKVLPLHFLAFSVEVEPNVINIRVSERFVQSCKLLANAVLASFFVNQVYDVLLRIVCLGLFEMLLGSLVRLIKVSIYDNWWCPRQSRFHLPQQGDRPTDLQMCSNRKSAILLLLS